MFFISVSKTIECVLCAVRFVLFASEMLFGKPREEPSCPAITRYLAHILGCTGFDKPRSARYYELFKPATFLRRGVGEDVLLLHGYGSKKESFYYQINFLQNFR